jgi:hypothetical protein
MTAIPKLSAEARATMQPRPPGLVGGKRDLDAEYEWVMAKARVMSAGQLLFKHMIDEIGINAKHRWCPPEQLAAGLAALERLPLNAALILLSDQDDEAAS